MVWEYNDKFANSAGATLPSEWGDVCFHSDFHDTAWIWAETMAETAVDIGEASNGLSAFLGLGISDAPFNRSDLDADLRL